MKLQNKLFIFFISSILLSLIATTSFVYFLLKQNNEIFENEKIENTLASAFQLYKNESSTADAFIDKIMDKITIINREYSKAKVLKKDILIGGELSLLIFLIIQGSLLLFFFFFGIRAITAQLRIVYQGLLKIEDGEKDYRIPSLKGNEFKILGTEFNRMLDRLAQNERIIREQSILAGWKEVASFLSHQLKNPITSINIAQKNVELCLDDPEKRNLVENNLNIIGEETHRLTTLINRLKELSSFPELSKHMLNIKQIILAAAARFTEKQVKFSYHLIKLKDIMLDKDLMEQVFINLFINSLEAANKQDWPVEIIIKGYEEEDKIILIITDSITGLPHDIVKKVMLPKFTTKKEGTGLGLAFVKKIITLHGGEITVDLTAVGGLQFKIKL